MRADALVKGLTIVAYGARWVVDDVRPDTTSDHVILYGHNVIEETTFLRVLKGQDFRVITNEPVELNRDEIVAMVTEGIERQLEKGKEHYGTSIYTGSDPLGAALEEVFDTLVYLWVQRKRMR